MMPRTLCIALALASAPLVQGVDLPVLPDTIPPSIARRRPDLPPALLALKLQRTGTLGKVEDFKKSCAEGVVVGSKQERECDERLPGVLADAKLDQQASAAFLADLANETHAQAVIDAMNAQARRLRWEPDELKRLDAALNGLKGDGRDGVTANDVSAVWRDLRARGDGAEWKRAAAAGQGPVFLGSAHSGSQSSEDCAIFAIASASGEPYSVVAARAARLISEGEWRSAAARAAPQLEIERRGLIGGEVVMLAEAFGEVQVVKSGMFTDTLKAGRSVMVAVFPAGVVFRPDGGAVAGHQVTLTRTFQRGSETWYEMIDSNQTADKRSYLSSAELMTILKENGVAFRPNAKNIPRVPK